MLGEAAIERLLLLLNHVVASEAVATRRMQPHAGRSIQIHLDGWPARLPSPPSLSFRVTPAGLFEWCGTGFDGEPSLRVHVAVANPALVVMQALAGTRPRIDVAGDAVFAADLQWLIDHLRWDIEDDLARVVGPAAARQIARVAGVLVSGLREAVRGLSAVGAAAARGASAMPQRP